MKMDEVVKVIDNLESEDLDKAIAILKELLYGKRENLSAFGIDEELAYAINHLKAYKEKRK